jgi:hypothetical protein
MAKDPKEMKLWVELLYPFTIDAENEVPYVPLVLLCKPVCSTNAGYDDREWSKRRICSTGRWRRTSCHIARSLPPR